MNMNGIKAMTAMVWKELRENAKWAALGLLAVAVAMAFALHNVATTAYGNPYVGLAAPTFQVSTVFGAAAIGLLLGMMQVFPEVRPDHWAFLVHRPISAARIFLSKIVAGLLMLALSVLIPLAGALVWARMPGHIAAPFDWRLGLPGVADTFAGAAYYFAGVLIARRQARWLGSRILVLGTAIVGSIFACALSDFWQAAMAAIGMDLIAGAAAFGTFTRGGHYEPQPKLAKLALGTSVALGLLLLGTACIGLISELLPQQTYTWTNYQVDRQGRIVRLTQIGQTAVVTDLEGNIRPDYRTSDYRYFLRGASVWLPGSRQEADRELALAIDRSYRTSTRFFFIVPSHLGKYWYYVTNERDLVGYDPASRRLIGRIALDGFVLPPNRPDRPFEGILMSAWGGDGLLTFDTGVYRLHEEDLRVDPMFIPPPGEVVYSAAQAIWAPDPEPGSPLAHVVATQQALYIIDAHDQIVRLTVPAHTSVYRSATVYRLPDGSRYLLLCQPYWPAHRGAPSTAIEYSTDGTLVSEQDLPAPNEPGPRSPDWETSVLLVVPPAGMFGIVIIDWVAQGNAFWHGLMNEGLHQAVLGTGFLLAGSVISALLTAWLARRYAFTRRRAIGWTVGNLLLGFLGLLAMLAILDWPALVPCPACGRRRRIDRENCEHCAAPFPAPKADGTEIFDAGPDSVLAESGSPTA